MKLKLPYSIFTPLLLLSACASDDAPKGSGVPTTVQFTIACSLPQTTRTADGTPSPSVVSDNELINDWWLAFAKEPSSPATGFKIEKVLKRAEAEGTNSQPTGMESFKTIIPGGTYSIFAFANIAPDDMPDFAEGKTISLPESLAWRGDSINCLDIDSRAIPMTGIMRNVRIENTIEETFRIEVVRMAARIDLLFSNSSENAITLSGIGWSPTTAAATPEALFPDYAALGEHAFTPRKDALYGWIAQETDIQVNANTPAYAAKRISFYIQESLSQLPNDNAFTLALKLRHEGGVSDSIQYNITQDIRQYINRNDLIRIPINLSRYAVDVKALFYPPIGGYPPIASDLDPRGSQIFTFHTGGDFSIVPYVADKQSGSQLAPSLYETSFSLDDPSGIITRLESENASSSLPHHLTGKLSKDKTGTATVVLSVKVFASADRDPSALPIQTYTRKIFIIRENLSSNETE